MLRALFSGVSGLNQNIIRLDVIGNNIANVSTFGYKSARVSFADAFSQTLRGSTTARANQGGINPIQVGAGVRVNTITNRFTQGNIQTTGGAADLAVQGDGFFIVNNGEEDFYTRAGNFTVDTFGRLVQAGTGYIVQGFQPNDSSVTAPGTLGALTVPFDTTSPAATTTEISLRGNMPLDSEAHATIMESGAFADVLSGGVAGAGTLLTDLRRAGGTDQLLFAGDSVNLTSAVGEAQIDIDFAVGAGSTMGDLVSFIETELGVPAGNVIVTADGTIRVEGDVDRGLAGTIGTLRLTAQGPASEDRPDFNISSSFVRTQDARDAQELIQQVTVYDALGSPHGVKLTFTRENGELAWNWRAEVDGQTDNILSGGSGRVAFFGDGTLASFSFDDGSGGITFDPGTGADSPQSMTFDIGTLGDVGGLTLLHGTSTLIGAQDGHPIGQFVDFAIDGSGAMFSLFSNGVREQLGELALAKFNDPTSLLKDGDSLFTLSGNSGVPTTRRASEIAGTNIIVGALEQSNVDLAAEFSEMIISQRAFQASSRVIQTSSDILAELMQLVR